MPNWCDNVATITGDPKKLKELAEAFTNGKFCSAAYPEPDYELLEVTPTFPHITRSTAPVDPKEAWWDWRVQNWGTKWDVGGSDSAEPTLRGNKLDISFSSAWSPPVGVYEQLKSQGFHVVAYYYEPGMNFAGKWDDGDDNTYECDDVPKDVDEMFGISQMMEDEDE